MPLQVADWHDSLKILHESAPLWSAGLSPVNYLRYTRMQMAHPWFRQGVSFLVFYKGGRACAGCKVHSLTYTARGKSLPFLGLSAIFTLTADRNQGIAHEMIEEVVSMAENRNKSGVVLYSEIGEEFYEEFGFEPLGSIEFEIGLDRTVAGTGTKASGEKMLVKTKDCRPEDGQWMAGQYSRWLRKQPFGVVRTAGYLNFKIARENFLHEHSKLDWPQLQWHRISDDKHEGYALTEHSQESIRIFEIVGGERVRRELWRHLVEISIERDLKLLRGWEAVVQDLAPTYKISALPEEASALLSPSAALLCREREWGRCMMLFLDEGLRRWLDVNPCPMLEFDHL